VNGNLGAQRYHYAEGMSAPYRAVLTDLPTGITITLQIGFDIKHSDKNAIDYLTSYNRLQPHTQYGHTAEAVQPTDGVAGPLVEGPAFNLPAPTGLNSPVPGQTAASFKALPAGEKKIFIWNGTISNRQYIDQGDLTASQ